MEQSWEIKGEVVTDGKCSDKKQCQRSSRVYKEKLS